MNNSHYALIALDGVIEIYSSKTYTGGGAVGEVLKDLTFENEDVIDVFVSGDALIDVTVNDKSLGHFFITTLCEMYGFSKPDVLEKGVSPVPKLIDFETEYLVSMFGDF